MSRVVSSCGNSDDMLGPRSEGRGHAQPDLVLYYHVSRPYLAVPVWGEPEMAVLVVVRI